MAAVVLDTSTDFPNDKQKKEDIKICSVITVPHIVIPEVDVKYLSALVLLLTLSQIVTDNYP